MENCQVSDSHGKLSGLRLTWKIVRSQTHMVNCQVSDSHGKLSGIRLTCTVYILGQNVHRRHDVFHSTGTLWRCRQIPCYLTDPMIITLFNKGLKQREISCDLDSYGHKISERHLRRVLKLLGLTRRCPQRPFTEIHKAVESEMKQWSPEQGIRAMVKWVSDVRVVDNVANIMRDMNASGLQRRSPGKKKIPRRNYISRGPNDTWHIDGNDKLKFFGMWIHLGIDGGQKPNIAPNMIQSYVRVATLLFLPFQIFQEGSMLWVKCRWHFTCEILGIRNGGMILIKQSGSVLTVFPCI
ncbi:hypothetical protein ACER0C_001799 [Sarotherodon galilaeus]